MSKPETNIVSVPLANAYLNLNQEKDEVRNYDGFNKLNAPYYGGNLTPLWRKFLGASGSSSYTDENETVYKIEDGIFSKTERGGNTEVLKDDFQQYTAEEIIFENRTYKWYYNENNYAAITDTGSVTVTLNGVVVGSYNNFENILFSENRAVIVTSTNAIFFFNENSVLELLITNDRYNAPTYTVFDGVMIVSINNKLYAFRNDETVTELTVVYTGSADVTYGATRLYCEVPSDYPYMGDIRNYGDSGNLTINLSEIQSNLTLNGEQSQQYDHSDEGSGSTYGDIKCWQINTNKTYLEWLYNGEHEFDKDILSGFVLSPYKSNILIPSTLCITSECLGNIAVGFIGSKESGFEAGYLKTKGFLNSLFKYYNIFNVVSSEILSLSQNTITIDLLLDKKATLTPRYSGTYYSQKIQPWHDFRNEGGFTCYYKAGLNYSSLDEAYALLNEYKNLYTYQIKNRTVELTITGNKSLGELKKTTSLISLKDNPMSEYDDNPELEEYYTLTSLYNTVFYSYNLSYITNAQNYDLSTTRGYALNISSYFRLLANNGYISAVSMFNDENCLGTLISNFGTTGIEYVYAVTDTRLVYVDDKNKVHVIDVIPFSGNENMTVLLGRYFVFNAVGVNCYDVVARTWSRIGMDWNNRFIIADYSESTDTKYYMTSAIFRTTDNTPSLSMLFNADYLNHIPYTALTPQYAQDATIQLYGADEPNNSVLYLGSFVFSSNEWTVFTESSYDGTTAESNSDNNLLIPASLLTQYVTSYLNDIYAVMSDGFTPLYKNNNAASTIKFNYYIGSLISDLGLDALFILQGQYYRLSDKIIYAYSYSGGQLVDTQEICNVGSLSFVGASPSEAFFWSFANRTLYKFTGARTVESVMCADSVKAIYASLYDTTTSSLYVSTDIGLMVYNAFGNFIINEIKMATELTSTKLGITYKDENRNLYGLYYNAVDGEDVIPVTLETAFYGASTVQNVINDTLYVKIFNKDKLSKGVVKFGGYIQQNYGETKELVSKTIEVTSSQFDKNTNVLLLRYQPDKQRGIGVSWKIESDFPISFVGVGASQTSELNVPKGNSPVMTTQKYNI